MFPQAAAANPSIFYDRAGRPAGAGAVYGKLTGRYDVARALTFAPSGRTVAPARYRRRHAGLCASPQRSAAAGAADSRPLFQSMFTDRPQGGVSQTVNTLWGAAKAEAQAADEPSKLLDLFRDAPPPCASRSAARSEAAKTSLTPPQFLW